LKTTIGDLEVEATRMKKMLADFQAAREKAYRENIRDLLLTPASQAIPPERRRTE